MRPALSLALRDDLSRDIRSWDDHRPGQECGFGLLYGKLCSTVNFVLVQSVAPAWKAPKIYHSDL